MVGAIVALAMARGRGPRGPRILRAALVVFAWNVAVALLLVIPDLRVLRAVAYAPIFLIGAPFGWPQVNYSSRLLRNILFRPAGRNARNLIPRSEERRVG